MNYQKHDIVQIPNKNIVFKIVEVGNNNVMMVDIQKPHELWTAHFDEIEPIQCLQFLGDIARGK